MIAVSPKILFEKKKKMKRKDEKRRNEISFENFAHSVCTRLLISYLRDLLMQIIVFDVTIFSFHLQLKTAFQLFLAGEMQISKMVTGSSSLRIGAVCLRFALQGIGVLSVLL